MLRSTWDEVCARVRAQEDPSRYDPWLDCLHFVAADGDQLVLSTPNRLYLDWIQDNLECLIVPHLRAVTGREWRLEYRLDPSLAAGNHVPRVLSGEVGTLAEVETTRLNPRQTFESYVVGTSNQFAFAACTNVAEKPARNFNPLFLFSGVGLGKTHLLHSIGNRIRQRDPSQRVAYLSAENFTNELISSLQKKRMEDFRERYRQRCDVLLVDDIQVLGGKERTQEEFVHTFNALHQAGKQIVVTGDRYPKDIEGLEDRLRSRFDWGLVADIQPPDTETKVAILKRKADEEGISLPQDVAFFVARSLSGNVRELMGVLNRLLAMASFLAEPITVDFARRWLLGLLTVDSPRPDVDGIVDSVARHYSLRPQDIRGIRRTKQLVEPRQLAMYFARKHTDLSLPELGRNFSRDHTTVLYAIRKVEEDARRDPAFQVRIEAVEKAIGLKKQGG